MADGPPDEPATQLGVLVRRVGGACRRLVEWLAYDPVQTRHCAECGDRIATEPTESSLNCPECALGREEE
jgi:NADH pyrophosphatase NudC (nudix superfamily)